MNLHMHVGDRDTVTMVHCNKCTAIRALASVAIDYEKEVYLYTDVVRGHHVHTCEITGGKNWIGGDMHVSLCCKVTLAYQEAQVLL